jgi:hypothetical protein
MDNFKLPMREIRLKYTKSELVLMAWDSRQKAYNMHKLSSNRPKIKDVASSNKIEYVGSTSGKNPNNISETVDAYEMPSTLNKGIPILKKWFNEEGELDLRKATGPQAVRYLNALGLNIAMGHI